MGRFTKALSRLLPRTGRIITERGTYVNEADILERKEAGSDPFGHTWVAEYTPIIERKPLPEFSALRDEVTGAGTVAVAGGEINIDGAAGVTALYTRDYGRYIPGLYALAGIGVRFGTPGTGTYEYGYGNSVGDRIGMEVVGGDYFTFIESDSDRYYRKARSEWLDPLDGTGPSGLTMDESQHVFRMKIGWYGYLSISFFIIVADRVLGDTAVLIDRIEDRSGVSIRQPDLPIFAEATGGTLHVGGRQYGVYGRYAPSYRITSAVAEATVGETFTPVCSFRIKDTVAWRSVPVKIAGYTAITVDSSDIVVIIGGTLTGAAFGAVPGIDASETALEFDDTATAVSGGYHAYVDTLASGQGNTAGNKSAEVSDIQVPRDQVVTLAARAIAGTTTARGALRLQEEW